MSMWESSKTDPVAFRIWAMKSLLANYKEEYFMDDAGNNILQ